MNMSGRYIESVFKIAWALVEGEMIKEWKSVEVYDK
jgi:hypothetical protein